MRFTNLEVHNISRCHQSRTESWQQITRTENSVNNGHVTFEICELRDRQTDRQIYHKFHSSQYFASLPWEK